VELGEIDDDQRPRIQPLDQVAAQRAELGLLLTALHATTKA